MTHLIINVIILTALHTFWVWYLLDQYDRCRRGGRGYK